MSKITDYPPGPGINGSEQVLIATPAGPASTNYTYTMADIRTYAGSGGGGGGSGTVTSVALAAPDIFTVTGTPVTTTGTLTLAAVNPGAAADRVVFWDDSAGKWTYLTMGTNLSITGTTLNATGGGGVSWGAISGTLSAQTDLQAALDAKIAGPGAVTTGRTVVFSGTSGTVVAQASRLEADLVAGPASATSGRIAVYNGTGGKTLQDGTKLEADVVTGPASATTARVATFNGTTGKVIQDGGVLLADLVVGPASVTTGRVASYNGTTGKLIADGGILVADVVTGPASATSGRVATFNGATGKIIQDGGTLLSNIPTMASNAGASGRVLTSAGADKTVQDSGTLLTALAPLASPVFTGDPTAPTPTTGDDDTSIATTAFVQASVTALAQNSQSAAYTLVLSDKGKHIFHPSADTTARTWTIPANSSVAFAVGTVITFVNQNAGGVITIAITTDTMRLAGAGTTGSRTLAANGIATAIKVASTEWLINGTGLT